MTNETQITENEKEKIANALADLYNPKSIGQIEKYPPFGEYYVCLYFDAETYSIKMSNRYNHPIEGDNYEYGKHLFDFEITNMCKVGNELNVTVKVTKQNHE